MEYGIAPLDGAGGVKAQGVLQHISTIKNDLQNTDDRNQWAKTDINIANLRERTAPGEGRFQVENWKKENDGRDPDFAAIRSGMASRKMDSMINTLSQTHGVTVKTDVARLEEARFTLGADGKGTLQIPKAEAFRDLNHQASSVFQAVAHSSLARAAQRLVAARPPRGSPQPGRRGPRRRLPAAPVEAGQVARLRRGRAGRQLRRAARDHGPRARVQPRPLGQQRRDAGALGRPARRGGRLLRPAGQHVPSGSLLPHVCSSENGKSPSGATYGLQDAICSA